MLALIKSSICRKEIPLKYIKGKKVGMLLMLSLWLLLVLFVATDIPIYFPIFLLLLLLQLKLLLLILPLLLLLLFVCDVLSCMPEVLLYFAFLPLLQLL